VGRMEVCAPEPRTDRQSVRRLPHHGGSRNGPGRAGQPKRQGGDTFSDTVPSLTLSG